MKAFTTALAAWAVMALPAPPVYAAETPDAREIMQRVRDRNDGDNAVSELELVLIDKENQERRRRVRSMVRDHGEDRHQLVFFLSPADVKDTGLLTYDYEGEARDDDQWLYLPALKKTKRIASTDQSGSFLGTDFSYADLTRLEVDDYDFELLGEGEVYGNAVWQIQGVPRTPEERERTGYSKSVFFVRKDNDYVVRSIHWVERGNKLKYLDVKKLEEIDGVWVGTEIHMTTRKGSTTLHKTVMLSHDTRFDQDLSDDLFTVRQLEKGP